jgi:quercetin dioxygenase-like cupin family protein
MLAGPVLAFDLAAQAAQLRYEHGYREGERNAITLVHEPDFRIVMIGLRPGARIQEHRTAGRLSIQTLAGRLRLRLPEQTVELPAGHLLALEPGVTHDVEALEDSTLLLTVAWPAGRGEG